MESVLNSFTYNPESPSGVKLVRICPKTGNFVVRIKRVTVGTFHTIEEAIAARDAHIKR